MVSPKPMSPKPKVTDDAVREAVRKGRAIAVVKIESVEVRADLWFDNTRMVYYRFEALKMLRESQSRAHAKEEFKFANAEEIWGGPAGQKGQPERGLLPGHAYLVICYHVKFPMLEHSREVPGADDPFVRDVEALCNEVKCGVRS